MKRNKMMCKCGGKLQMVKISHIEQIYDFKDNCFHQYDCDGYEDIYFRCDECNNKYSIEDDNLYITSINVEKLYVKAKNSFTDDIGGELDFNEVKFKLKDQ